jgi:membrane protease YdiL (CAAX protease family)
MVSQKSWQVESLLRLLARLLVCFAVGAVAAALLRHWLGNRAVESALLPMMFSILCLHGAGLVVIALFVREHQMGWAAAFGFRNEAGWAVVLGLCAAIIVLPACWWLQAESARLLPQFGFDPGEQDAVRALMAADVWWKQLLLGVFAVGLAPVAEEMFFRGIVYPMLKQKGFPQLALWGTAILFALIHGSLAVIVPLILLAVVLTLLYEWTNNLLSCIALHSLFNAANFVLLFLLKTGDALPGKP